jgi:translation initiation factor 3 subunit B
METGYHLYDFKGKLLREEQVDLFKQWLWRPRPPTLLSKEEQKEVRRKLRDYSKKFEEADEAKKNQASVEEQDRRRQLLQEWYSWRRHIKEDLMDERQGRGLPADRRDEEEDLGGDQVVEEWVEELIGETEEVIG